MWYVYLKYHPKVTSMQGKLTDLHRAEAQAFTVMADEQSTYRLVSVKEQL